MRATGLRSAVPTLPASKPKETADTAPESKVCVVVSGDDKPQMEAADAGAPAIVPTGAGAPAVADH